MKKKRTLAIKELSPSRENTATKTWGMIIYLTKITKTIENTKPTIDDIMHIFLLYSILLTITILVRDNYFQVETLPAQICWSISVGPRGRIMPSLFFDWPQILRYPICQIFLAKRSSCPNSLFNFITNYMFP